ncbi:MAG: hypothetical protein A2W31_07080 [Planctomycetes bacterium RBG_16_64_10]|nr:MAG: hypothetical protein A2W31_07080 [Planctomycetes bacterium RBG_16_64_10]
MRSVSAALVRTRHGRRTVAARPTLAAAAGTTAATLGLCQPRGGPRRFDRSGQPFALNSNSRQDR